MTHVLDAALAEIAKLPQEEQDALGSLLLDEMSSELRWRRSFATSGGALETLAREAVAEFKAGKALPLDESL